MREHAEVGQRFPTITNYTTYSFGIDDQEFMTAFECEAPSDFLELMMTLREIETSRYTERDTPIFVGDVGRSGRSSTRSTAPRPASRPSSVAVRVLVPPDAGHHEGTGA